MGVLRLAPDAFPDSGRSLTRAAVARGRRMISEGADIVEISCMPCSAGSPAATPPEAEARLARQVASTIGALAGDVRVALATGSVELATAATAAGATIICDRSMVRPAAQAGAWHQGSAGTTREALIGVAAGAAAGWVAVHAPTRGRSTAGQSRARSNGTGRIVAETLEALQEQLGQVSAAGLTEVYVDPGIGCGRAGTEDLELLGSLERLASLGRPLVVGTGDGHLIDELHAAADAQRLPVADAPGASDADRLEGALVVAVWAMLAGAAVLRTQHVAATMEAARTVGAKQPVGTP